MQKGTPMSERHDDDARIDDELIALLVHEHRAYTRPALQRLWDYYRNELDFDAGDANRPYRAAQEAGLPRRLTAAPGAATRSVEIGGGRREVVIENDIAWRVHTLVDFMFGKPVSFESLAPDAERARLIERVINTVFEANGGVCLFQDMALLGGVYGFVDVMVRGASEGSGIGTGVADRAPSKQQHEQRVLRAAASIVIETVEAPRAVPVLDPSDYRQLVGYVLHYTQLLNRVDRTSFLARLVDGGGRARGRQATVDVTEVWTADEVSVYHDGELVEQRVNRLGRLPVVHVQNLPQPLVYEGLSEVEPLIPLQDELNTRLGGPAPYGYDRQYITPDGSVLRTIRTLPDGRREEFGADGRRIRIIDKCEHIGRKMKSDIVRLVPGEPGQVEAVRRIFKMCADGYGFRNIVIDLNSRGVPGPRRTRWNRQAVKTILQNPCYYGALVWNRRTFGKLHGVEPDGTPRRKTVAESTRNPRSQWIIIHDVHEPLITKELFDKAQAAMQERRNKGGKARPTNRYLLSGLIRCDHCGYNFWGCVVKNGRGDHRYYVDAGYRAQGIKVCRSTSIPTKSLDEWVLAQLRNLMLADGDTVHEAVDGFIEATMKACRVPQAKSHDPSKQLATIEQRIQATIQLLTDGELTDLPELRERLIQLKNQRQQLVSQPVMSEPTIPRASEKDLREWASRQLDQLERGLSGKLPPHQMRTMVHSYVGRIEIEPYKQVGRLFIPRTLADALTHEHISRVKSGSSHLTRLRSIKFTWGSGQIVSHA
ncbi:MAG: phage portal protein [Phycisphaera sp.]|nr:phage portal protein [Phycisphaera sp.]